jgi:hypothetical protein
MAVQYSKAKPREPNSRNAMQAADVLNVSSFSAANGRARGTISK